MKRRIMVLLCAFLAGILLSGNVVSQEGENTEEGLKVLKSAFCEKVEEREPVGKSNEFPKDIGRVYFWTSIHGTESPVTIKHVWYYNEKKMLEVPLSIKYKRTRTWSYKTILPEWVGEWQVEVVDEDDSVLGKYFFKIID